VRAHRKDVPVLVRTADDAGIAELSSAGATEVVPETFEASLMLVSQVLMLLNVPVTRVVRTIGEIRRARYATLRDVVPSDTGGTGDDPQHTDGLATIVIPPRAWAVSRTLAEVRQRGAEVVFTALRRHGITGREPEENVVLQAGDVLVVYGSAESIEHAEALLLTG
jgi:CPA2 family monovalent cation:H+ antiporter-2